MGNLIPDIMTKRILFFAFIIGFYSSIAQPIVTLQSGSTTSFYDNLDAAITDAVAGDILVLSGGTFTMSDTLRKGISIIGVGHNPDSATATGITIISTNIIIGATSDNTYIDGIYINGSIIFPYNERSDNVMIKRCNMFSLDFKGSHYSQYDSDSLWPHNTSLIHSVVRNSLNGGGSSYMILRGNHFNYRVQYMIKGGIIENNVFFSQGVNNYQTVFNEIRGFTIKNNVFYTPQRLDYGNFSCSNAPCGSYSNTIVNNVFVADSSTIELHNGISILHSNNMYSVTDIFVNQNGIIFYYTDDYHITTTSPGYQSALDGNDVGVYGSSDPLKEGGMSVLPWIAEKDIAPATNSSGGLPIYIKVKAQEN